MSIDRERIGAWVAARRDELGVTVEVTRPRTVDRDRDATMDDDLVVTPAEPTATYTGPASIGTVRGRSHEQVREAGQSDSEVDAVLGFPLDADVTFGDEGTVTDSPDDPTMVGRRFRVVKVRDSSYRIRRVCECVDVQR